MIVFYKLMCLLPALQILEVVAKAIVLFNFLFNFHERSEFTSFYYSHELSD